MYWTLCVEKGGPQRVNHAAVAIEDRIWSFGGYCSEIIMPFYIDVYCCNTNTLKWVNVKYEMSNVCPKACYGHSVVAYGHEIYLWGGQNGTTACNSLYCFNTKTLSWSMPKTRGYAPKQADGHSACVVGNDMFIFGGFEGDNDTFSQDLYKLNLTNFTWQIVHTIGSPPSKRDFHSSSVIGNRIYIFGGRSLHDSLAYSEYYPSNIMYFDTKSSKWNTPTCVGKIPCGRRSHSAVVYKDEIYVLGGFTGLNGVHLNDVYKYNPTTSEWTEMKVQGKPPCPRRRHCCVVAGDCLYLFGGSSPLTESYILGTTKLIEHSDLHVLDFFPTLKRLCQMKVTECNLPIEELPVTLQSEIKSMTSQQYFIASHYAVSLLMLADSLR